jgi:hypothetical protein
MRLIITEAEKEDILSKYKDNTEDRLLTYLRRNFPVSTVDQPRYDPETDEYKDVKVPVISVDDKIRYVESNKKYLVNKIFTILEDELTDIPNDVKRRTIKKYIDMINLTDF